MEANQQVQEEVQVQVEDAHGGQSPPQMMEEAQAQAHMQAHQRVDLGQP